MKDLNELNLNGLAHLQLKAIATRLQITNADLLSQNEDLTNRLKDTASLVTNRGLAAANKELKQKLEKSKARSERQRVANRDLLATNGKQLTTIADLKSQNEALLDKIKQDAPLSLKGSRTAYESELAKEAHKAEKQGYDEVVNSAADYLKATAHIDESYIFTMPTAGDMHLQPESYGGIQEVIDSTKQAIINGDLVKTKGGGPSGVFIGLSSCGDAIIECDEGSKIRYESEIAIIKIKSVYKLDKKQILSETAEAIECAFKDLFKTLGDEIKGIKK